MVGMVKTDSLSPELRKIDDDRPPVANVIFSLLATASLSLAEDIVSSLPSFLFLSFHTHTVFTPWPHS